MAKVSPLSWLIFALSVASCVVLAWKVDPHTAAGVARIIGSVLAGIVAVLSLVNGARIGARLAAIETGRYPRLRSGAASRIAARLRNETPQTTTIAGEAGDDIREIAAILVEALRSANWHTSEPVLGGALWNGGRGILIHHTEGAASAATALIEALTAEGLLVSDAGNPSTGNPVQIEFRRP